MTIQGLILIDRQEMSDEEFSEFKQFTNKYFIDFKRLNTKDNIELYSCIARDKNLLFDQQNEEGETIQGVFSLISHRSPQILGLWKQDGLLLGTERVQTTENVIDENDNIIQAGVWEIQGTPEYPFDKQTYISFMPDIVTYDEEGNEISRTRPTEAKQLHKFAGYSDLVMD